MGHTFMARVGTPHPVRHTCPRRNDRQPAGAMTFVACCGESGAAPPGPTALRYLSPGASAEGSCRMVVQKALAVAVCMREDARIRVRSPRRGRTDGDDSSPLEPRGQRSQRHGLLLAGTGSADGRRGQRELAAMARAGFPGLVLFPPCGHPLAGRQTKAGPRRPGLRRCHRAAVGRRGMCGRCCGRRLRARDQRAASRAADLRRDSTAQAGPAWPAAAGAVCAMRGLRPGPGGSGGPRARRARRDGPRALCRRLARRPVGLHHPQR